MSAARVCELHPTSAWKTSKSWTRCVSCETARKREWARARRAAGQLREQTPEALAARRVKDRETYAWKTVHAAYLRLCDALDIPTDKETTA